MTADSLSLGEALQRIQSAATEPTGDFEFVRVFVDVYVHRRCPRCDRVRPANHDTICIDCSEAEARANERKKSKEVKAG